MIKDELFYTITMAKVCADQGKYSEALKIYRYLLEKEPDNRVIAESIIETQKVYYENSSKILIDLFSQWFKLIIQQGNLEKLKKFSITPEIAEENY